jgi:hypothetical protein
MLTTGAVSSSNMLHIRVSSLSPPHLLSVLHEASWTVFVQFLTLCLVLCLYCTYCRTRVACFYCIVQRFTVL